MEERTGQPYELKKLGTVIRLGLLAFLIGMIASALISLLVDRDTLFSIVPGINPLLLTVPFGLYLAINVVDTFRLRMVLGQFDMRIGLGMGFVNSVIGILFNNVTPMNTGGHPFQIYHLKRVGIPAKTATNVILSRHVEKLVLQALVTILAVPVVLQVARSLEFGSVVIYAGVGLVTLLALALLLVLARPDVVASIALKLSRRKLNRFIQRLTGKDDWADFVIDWTREMREQVAYLWNKRTPVMIVDALAGLFNQCLQGLSMWFMVRALTGIAISPINAVLTFIVVNHLVYYIPTPGASGSVEGMYTLVFASVTRLPEITFAAIFLWRFAAYYLHIVFGALVFAGYLRYDRRHSQEMTNAADDGSAAVERSAG